MSGVRAGYPIGRPPTQDTTSTDMQRSLCTHTNYLYGIEAVIDIIKECLILLIDFPHSA
jgi:hypothetical protein